MKRILALLAVLAVLLSLPGAKASASRDGGEDRTVVLDSDSQFLSPSRYVGQLGYDTLDQKGHFALRLRAFSRACGCDVYVGCMTSPAHMEPAAESFEAYRDRFLAGYPGALGEKAVCLLYDQESNSALVHVGAAVSESCDTSSVENVLRDPKETDSYFRMVHALDALQQALGGHRSLLLTNVDDGSVYSRLEKALEPLRKVFDGPVLVFYESTENNQELRENARAEFDAYNTYSWTPAFYPDGIILYYYRNTGEALVQLGEDVSLRLTEAAEVEAASPPARARGTTRALWRGCRLWRTICSRAGRPPPIRPRSCWPRPWRCSLWLWPPRPSPGSGGTPSYPRRPGTSRGDERAFRLPGGSLKACI